MAKKAVMENLNDLNIKVRDSRFGNTALHRLAQESHFPDQLHSASLLIQRGLRVNDTNFDKQTPLHMAVNNYEMAKHLLENKADVNVRDYRGETPLHRAASQRNYEVIKLLIAHNANVNANDNYGRTPLNTQVDISLQANEHRAVLVCLNILVENGAKIQDVDEIGRTPMHEMAAAVLPTCVKRLIELGVDVNAKDSNDNTPLHRIARSIVGTEDEKLECCQMLLEAGADATAKNKDGKTAADLASFKVMAAIVKYKEGMQITDQKMSTANATEQRNETNA